MTTTRESALEALTGRVSPRSADHCRAVAKAAEELARRHGVDPDEAWLAGLLHDWARDESPDELFAQAARLGLEMAPIDHDVPYLLHARVGRAQLSSAMTDLSPAVLDAIERHTVGSPEMTDLDMCVYVADMIEPARRFDGVDALREAAATLSLFDLYARAYAASLAHLLTARKYIHPASLQAWNAIVAEERR
ncbi:MAG: bis(5'-nucleosyl)-tetraphosphatase (symmetrical) YqeK [Actinomycetota bacterium]|nr:bis(5'-nucleosyl)-tetraphosphatase (symmetrical) YqeK [Actinomycetota bacterium]